jgi:hypothetical protein
MYLFSQPKKNGNDNVVTVLRKLGWSGKIEQERSTQNASALG